jgi:hypothetical protein
MMGHSALLVVVSNQSSHTKKGVAHYQYQKFSILALSLFQNTLPHASSNELSRCQVFLKAEVVLL